MIFVFFHEHLLSPFFKFGSKVHLELVKGYLDFFHPSSYLWATVIDGALPNLKCESTETRSQQQHCSAIAVTQQYFQ